MLRTLDGGRTWQDIDTGIQIFKNPATLQWSGTLMAPALDVSGDGTIVAAWSQQTIDPMRRAAGSAAEVLYARSVDQGETWTLGSVVSGTRTAIMPWVTGGAGQRTSIAYYAASDVRVDNNYEGTWDAEIVFLDDTDSGSPQLARHVLAQKIHAGGICSRGGVCFATVSDRSFLDYFETALAPDGSLLVAFAKDATESASPLGGSVHAMFAKQGGDPWLMSPADSQILI